MFWFYSFFISSFGTLVTFLILPLSLLFSPGRGILDNEKLSISNCFNNRLCSS